MNQFKNEKRHHKYSCSSAISTLEGIENKRRLQTLSTDSAWSNKNFLYNLGHALSMDNVCNRRLFSVPSKVGMKRGLLLFNEDINSL